MLCPVIFNKPEYANIDNDYYFLYLDGMYVPFFVEEFLYNSDVTARIKFKVINSIEQASNYSNIVVLIPEELLQEIVHEKSKYSTEWEQYIGYTVLDENSSVIGVVQDVDSSTINALFIIINGDEEILIPATQDFIEKIDSKQKQLYLNLPEGLLDSSFED